jgi:MFS family permease
LFVKPITEANGWGREVISVALAVQNLCWGIVAVFAGGLADRFGNAKVIVAGTVLYALGMQLMSGVDNPWLLNVSTGLLVGAGVAGTSFGIVLPAMARAVGEERRQWALGLGTAVGSLGQFAVVPVAHWPHHLLRWPCSPCRWRLTPESRRQPKRQKGRPFPKPCKKLWDTDHMCCWFPDFLFAAFTLLLSQRTCPPF